jgi:hypothetical protein
MGQAKQAADIEHELLFPFEAKRGNPIVNARKSRACGGHRRPWRGGGRRTAAGTYLLLLPGDVPDPPAEVLQPVAPLLAVPHRYHLQSINPSSSANQSRTRITFD